MRRITVVALAVLLAAAEGWLPVTANEDGGSQKYGTIVGLVCDAAAKKPVGGATVKVDATHQAVTAPSGVFALPGLTAGTVQFTVAAAGYTTANSSATVTAGKATAVQIALTRSTSSGGNTSGGQKPPPPPGGGNSSGGNTSGGQKPPPPPPPGGGNSNGGNSNGGCTNGGPKPPPPPPPGGGNSNGGSSSGGNTNGGHHTF